MATADKVLAAAERWLGYLEKRSAAQLDSLTANAGDGNYTIFAEQYRERWGEDYQAQPWCAVFVSDMLYEGCGREIVPHFAYCPYGVEGFKRRGQWARTPPLRGDVIFFRDSRGVACHVGLVSGVGGGRVVTIEGNTSSAAGVVANGGCVRKKSYELGYAGILGYGRPVYEEEDEDMTQEQFNALYDKVNPMYRSIDAVPVYWREEAKALMACGAIAGDDKTPIAIRREELQAAVIAYRAAVALQK